MCSSTRLHHPGASPLTASRDQSKSPPKKILKVILKDVTSCLISFYAGLCTASCCFYRTCLGSAASASSTRPELFLVIADHRFPLMRSLDDRELMRERSVDCHFYSTSWQFFRRSTVVDCGGPPLTSLHQSTPWRNNQCAHLISSVDYPPSGVFSDREDPRVLLALAAKDSLP